MRTKAAWDSVERLVALAKRVQELSVRDDCAVVAKYDQAGAAWREKLETAGLPLDERTVFTVLLTMQSVFDAIEYARENSLSEAEATLFQMRLTSSATAVCAAFNL